MFYKKKTLGGCCPYHEVILNYLLCADCRLAGSILDEVVFMLEHFSDLSFCLLNTPLIMLEKVGIEQLRSAFVGRTKDQLVEFVVGWRLGNICSNPSAQHDFTGLGVARYMLS